VGDTRERKKRKGENKRRDESGVLVFIRGRFLIRE